MLSKTLINRIYLNTFLEAKLFFHKERNKVELDQCSEKLLFDDCQQQEMSNEQLSIENDMQDLNKINAFKSVHSLINGVSPSKKFVYWAFRRLRELPANEYFYYLSLLRQEIQSKMYVNEPFEAFFFIVEGYRKVKWVLEKFNVSFDESLIPSPYNNFWSNSTYEERAWVFYRSQALKEEQSHHHIYNTSMKEEEDSALENNLINQFTNYSIDRDFGLRASQSNNNRYSKYLPLPFEDDISYDDLHMSDADQIFAEIENAKRYNPILISRYRESSKNDERKGCYAVENMFDFEDEED